jgi:hypothetical protein
MAPQSKGTLPLVFSAQEAAWTADGSEKRLANTVVQSKAHSRSTLPPFITAFSLLITVSIAITITLQQSAIERIN